MNLLYFNASCPFCQRRSSANTTNARSFRTGRLWEEGDNTKGDRAPARRLAGMSGGLLYRGSDGNGGQRPPSGPRPRLSALDLSAASRRLSGKPCRPGRAGTVFQRGGARPLKGPRRKAEAGAPKGAADLRFHRYPCTEGRRTCLPVGGPGPGPLLYCLLLPTNARSERTGRLWCLRKIGVDRRGSLR